MTPAVVNERGDIEIQDYVFFQEDIILDLDVSVWKVHRVPSTGGPQPDGALNKTARMKNRHYRQIYEDRSDPIVFLSIVVSTSGRVYEDFTRLFFLHAHRETGILAGELPEESEQFRFLRASLLSNLKGSVGLILTKASAM